MFRQNTLEKILVGLGVIFYLFVFPHGTHGDAWARWLGVQALVEQGEWYPHKYSMVGPLLSIPLYHLGALVKTPHWWVSRYNAILFLAFIFVFCRLVRPLIPEKSGPKLALLLLTATMFPKHVTDFYGEIFTVTLTGLGFLWFARQESVKGLIALPLAAANTPASLVGLGLGTLASAWEWKRFRYLLPAGLTVLLIVLENQLRLGSFFSEKYLQEVPDTSNALYYARQSGFQYPFAFGFPSILFSFGKGLLFFTPGLWLVFHTYRLLPPVLQNAQKFWLFYLMGLILVYSKWNAWTGDWFWGPRYFLFASLPATLAIFALMHKEGKSIMEHVCLLSVLTLSVWVGVSGVAFGQSNLEICGENHGLLMPLCWYTPDYSTLWRPFFAEKGLHGKQIAFLVYFSLVYSTLSFKLWKDLWIQIQTKLSRTLAEQISSAGWRL